MRRTKSPRRTATAAAPFVGLPATAQMSYREFIKDVLPQITSTIHASWERDWMGAGLYDSSRDLINDLTTYGGALPKVAELYRPDELNIPATPTHELTFVRDVSGPILDVDAYMAGEAECFIEIQPAPVQKSQLTIRVLHAVSGDVSAKDIVNKYMLVADLYTAALAKYNVRLIFEVAGNIMVSSGPNIPYNYCLTMSDYGQPLDPYTLVSALSGPMYRSMMRGLSRSIAKNVYGVDFHPDQKKYLTKPAAVRMNDEIIISPIYSDTAQGWNLRNMLKESGLLEGE